MTRFARMAVAACAIALAAPAAAVAAPPTVKTHNAANVSQTTATLRGSVNPRSNRTFAFFQYGTSRLYGAQTPETDVGNGKEPVRITADIAGLEPFTTYHYRAVAQQGQRLVFGENRTFRTRRQPLGVTLGASPTLVRANGETTISGQISGTDRGGRQVVLQSNPYPFAGFGDASNPQIADAEGFFSFNVLDVPVNTIFRVRLPEKPNVESPELTVSVKIGVRSRVQRKVRKGREVRFRGAVSPPNAGAQVLIQRRIRKQWVTWKRTEVGDASRYSKKVRIWKTSKWRVVVVPGPEYVTNTGSVKRIKVVKKK